MPTSNTRALLADVKAAGQDFEWYPTTREILECVHADLMADNQQFFSMLDCGAGDGKVFTTLNAIHATREGTDDREQWRRSFFITAYAIEKSQVLIEALPNDIFIIGTDFEEQTLIDKKVDVIFSNPPYSAYGAWAEKIIRETAAKTAYIVIPERWVANQEIADALRRRRANSTVLGTFDFVNAEDRSARAVVHLVKIEFGRYLETDPFSVWFAEHFSMDVSPNETHFDNETRRAQINELVSRQNLIADLVRLYNRDLEDLLQHHKKLGELDPQLLGELGVSLHGVRESLKVKVTGLKSLYWKVLFDRIDPIVQRLTKSSRDRMLEKLTSQTSVDLTQSNILAVVVWVVKNANQYFDRQLTEVYLRMADRENIVLYKSNRRVISDGWRYLKHEMDHFKLDYRIIISCRNNFGGWYYEVVCGLTTTTMDTISDVFVVARNLGVEVDPLDLQRVQWAPGERQEFFDKSGTLFADVRAYKNGNVHMRFNPDFMKRLNVEAARLNGWIKAPHEAAEEFDVTMDEAVAMFGANLNLRPETALPFLGNTSEEGADE